MVHATHTCKVINISLCNFSDIDVEPSDIILLQVFTLILESRD